MEHFGTHFAQTGSGFLMPSKSTNAYTISQDNSDFFGFWDVDYTSAAEAMRGERVPMMSRIMDLIRNYGPAAGIVELAVEHLVATWTPLPEPNEKLLLSIGWTPDDILEWKQNQLCWFQDVLMGTNDIDASEKGNFRDVVEMCLRMRKVYGEITGVMKYKSPTAAGNRHREIGTALSLINPGRVDSPSGVRDTDTRRIIDGIEVDVSDNKVQAAWVYDRLPTEMPMFGRHKKPERIRKYGFGELSYRQMFIHEYRAKEVDGVRGVSDFVLSAEAMQLQRILQKTIMARGINQNKRTMVFESPHLTPQQAARQLGMTLGAGQQVKKQQASSFYSEAECAALGLQKWGDCLDVYSHQRSKKIHSFEGTRRALQGAQTIFTMPGETATLLNHDNGQLAATELNKWLDSVSASAHSIDQDTLNRDYRGGSYTSRRAGKTDYESYLQAEKRTLDKVSNQVYSPAAEEAVNIGSLPFPAAVIRRNNLSTSERRHSYFMKYRRALIGMGWSKPAAKMVEPGRDVGAYERAVKNKFMTQTDVTQQVSGRTKTQQDEIILQERKAEKDMELDLEQYEIDQRKARKLDQVAPNPDSENGGVA